jgi:2-amino-4-hydroxy-6-hydroxymethyldihydropteridine diphosphokinase
MPACLIGLGSNVGDREGTMEAAVARLAAWPAVKILARSSWHDTAPIGGPSAQRSFLNGALTLETSLAAPELLAGLLEIEDQLGRRREQRWGPRTIDLDLLLYGDMVLDSPSLVVPHPRLSFRRFVLEPAVEVAAQMIHPKIGWSIARLLDHLNTSARRVTITGPTGADTTRLAQRLAAATAGWEISEVSFEQFAVFCLSETGPARARLVVFLDCPTEKGLERTRLCGHESAETLLMEAWSRPWPGVIPRMDQPDLGPILHLGGDDLDAAFAETLAAMAGME